MSSKFFKCCVLLMLCFVLGNADTVTSRAEEQDAYQSFLFGRAFYDSQGLMYTFGSGWEDINPYQIKEQELTVSWPSDFWDASLQRDGITKVELKNDLVIPDEIYGHKVVDICEGAFEGCKNLNSVHLGKNVRAISARAFADCSNLKRVTLQSNLTWCGQDAFFGTPICKGAREQGKPLILGKVLVDGKGVKGNLTIKGSKVHTIAAGAFYQNKKIKKVKISGVKRIQGKLGTEQGAFVSSSVTDLTITGAKEIGEEAFLNCKKLKKAKVSGIKTVPVGMFHGCKKMASVTFGKEVQRFKKESLWHCWNLKTIRIHSKKKIVFEKSNERGYFFPPYPFLGCDKLRHVYMRSTKLSKTFKKTLELGDPIEKKITLHVPKGKKKLYRKYTKGKVATWKKA